MRKIFLPVILALSFLSFSEYSRFSPTLQSHAALSETAAFKTGRIFNELTAAKIEESIRRHYDLIGLQSSGLEYNVFRLGMIGYYTLRNSGQLNDKNIVTIIDFAKPSTEKLFFIIDLDKQELIYHTYVAHGKNTGENFATSFSNKAHSNQSSLGFYVTGETYVGSKGYSLRLDGQEKEYNDNIRERAVVMHDADYVSEQWIKRYGRLGRSQGCPALPKEIAKEIIDVIKNKTAIFAYYPDENYLKSSAYLSLENMMEGFAKNIATEVENVAVGGK